MLRTIFFYGGRKVNREQFHSLFIEEPKPIQDEDELWWIWNKLRERVKPLEIVIEVGVSGGGSIKFWRELVPVNGLLIGIDIQDYHWSLPDNGRNIHYVIGASENPKTILAVANILQGRKADFLYIDGHHEWENVYVDYVNYSLFVRKGGAIGFHDTGTAYVNRLFESLQGEKERIALAHGTGIVYV